MESINFYTRVLGFNIKDQHPDGYTLLTNGVVHIALNHRNGLANDHPIKIASSERTGLGVEIVSEVDDVAALHAHVISQD